MLRHCDDFEEIKKSKEELSQQSSSISPSSLWSRFIWLWRYLKFLHWFDPDLSSNKNFCDWHLHLYAIRVLQIIYLIYHQCHIYLTGLNVTLLHCGEENGPKLSTTEKTHRLNKSPLIFAWVLRLFYACWLLHVFEEWYIAVELLLLYITLQKHEASNKRSFEACKLVFRIIKSVASSSSLRSYDGM